MAMSLGILIAISDGMLPSSTSAAMIEIPYDDEEEVILLNG